MMQSKSPYRQWQGSVAHAQGKQFEQRLDAAFAYYRAQGLADIEKTPEPMRPVKNLGAGKFVAFFEKKAQADYSGVLRGGRAVMFEAKFTAGDRMKRERVTTEQAAFLERRQALGSQGYILAGFSSGNVYRLPWTSWRDMKEAFGHQYVTEHDLIAYQVPAKGLCPLVLEGLV